jgi:hypothetical protein
VFTVVLSNPSDPALDAGHAGATGTILDNDHAAVFDAESYVRLSVDVAQMPLEYECGYPIRLNVTDVDSVLTVEITEVPDQGQTGYHNGTTFIELTDAMSMMQFLAGTMMTA